MASVRGQLLVVSILSVNRIEFEVKGRSKGRMFFALSGYCLLVKLRHFIVISIYLRDHRNSMT